MYPTPSIRQRVLALLLVLLMLVSLTACGETTDDGSSQAPSSGTVSPGDPSTDNPSSGGTPSAPSSLAALPSPSDLDITAEGWVDCGSYAYFVAENISPDEYTSYYRQIKAAGFFGNGSHGNGFGMCEDFFKRDPAMELRTVRHSQSNMFALIVGDLPNRYYCWKMIGMTEEEIGPPMLDGDIDDYVVFDNGSDIDLYFSHQLDRSYYKYYTICDADLTRTEGFIAGMAANGFAQVKRETLATGQLYYEAAKCVDEDLKIELSLQLIQDKDTMQLCVLETRNRKDITELLEYMNKKPCTDESCTRNGRDPEASKPQLNTKLDFANATESALANGKVYLFDNMDIMALFDYLTQLENEGYREIEGPYVPDVFPNRGPDEPNIWLYKEGAGDKSCIFLYGNGSKNKIALFTAAAVPENIREHDLWRKVDMFIQPGIGYLETVVNQYVEDYGYPGAGRGWDSSGYIAYYGGGDAGDLAREADNLLDAGFTLHQVGESNGLTHTVYKRVEEFSGFRYTIYARLVLDGDFFEIEFGYGFRDTTHKG